MPSGVSAGISSSLPSSFSSSEHKSDSSSNSRRSRPSLLPVPSSVDPPATADQVIRISISSDEQPSWRRHNPPVHTGPMPWPGRTRSALRRYSPLVPPAALLIALVVLLVQDLANADGNADSSDLPTSNTTTIEWSICTMTNAVANAYNITAQCATIMVPLCYDDVCGEENENTTIAVWLKRIAAQGTANNSGASEQTVWYIPDRPDLQTRDDVELQMTLLYQELHRSVDIYTFDLRGTGNSTALTCNASDGSPLQASLFAQNGGAIQAADVQACATQLHELGYSNLSAFSLASVARDIETIVTEFHSDTLAVVYALGYGTLVAQQLMQRGVSEIVGYVFDGALGGPPVATESLVSSQDTTDRYQVSRSDADFGEVGSDFLKWCQEDANCAEMFSDTSFATTLNNTLLEVYDRLDTDATLCAAILTEMIGDGNNSATAGATPPSFLLRQLMAKMLTNSTIRPFIPVLAYRFHRCGSEDLTLLAQFVNTTFTADDHTNTPGLLYAIQAFSELWEQPTPDQGTLTDRFTAATISNGRAYSQLWGYCLFTGDTSGACLNATTSESTSTGFNATLSYETATTNTSANVIPSGASVLLLSGALDAVSPPKFSTALFDAFQGDNKALIVVPNGTHSVVQSALLSNGTACARQVLASYVRQRGNLSAYDTSCVAELPAASLAITNTSSLLILGVQDAYNGVLTLHTGVNSSGSSGSGGDVSSASNSSSGSTANDLNDKISALERSRRRYEVALIAVGSVLGGLLLLALVVFVYRRYRKRQLADEEAMLRRMRGDDDNEVDLMRSIYLLSSSSPSSGERTGNGSRQ